MTIRRRSVATAAVAVVLVTLSVDAASAWTCRAKSRVADGWGYSPVLRTAREEAKLQCMLHTAQRLPCRIVFCRR